MRFSKKLTDEIKASEKEANIFGVRVVKTNELPKDIIATTDGQIVILHKIKES